MYIHARTHTHISLDTLLISHSPQGGSKPKATVDDRRDGTYAVNFVPGWAGEYEVSICRHLFLLLRLCLF